MVKENLDLTLDKIVILQTFSAYISKCTYATYNRTRRVQHGNVTHLWPYLE